MKCSLTTDIIIHYTYNYKHILYSEMPAMPDYKSMCYHLFQAQLKAIGILEDAHCRTEKLFMDSEEPLELADIQYQSESGEKE